MKVACYLLSLLALVIVPVHLAGQENPKPDAKASSATLKLQVTVVEREGDKKVTNLPYTFLVKAEGGTHVPPWTKLRTGSRVPVYAGKDAGMQYVDVGTNIDARALVAEDGRFDVTLNLERSWVEGEVVVPVEKISGASPDTTSAHFKEPIIRQFKSELTLPIHDGQTTEITQAADPNSGRMLTITVTMNVLK
jgi:hypothetical protein